MIIEKEGRSFSVRTSSELEQLLERDLEHFTDDERQALDILMKEMGSPAGALLLAELSSSEYARPPVGIEEFVMDPYYLGATCESIYPPLLADLKELFGGGYEEAIWTGSVGGGKCVSPATEIFDAALGRRRLAGDFGKLTVASIQEKDACRLVTAEATAFPSGEKFCVRVSLEAGQQVVLSTDHPIFTARGWVPAGQITCTDLVATPRRMPAPEKCLDISDEEVKLVAYLLCDGGCTGNTTFTHRKPEVLREFSEVALACSDSTKYDKWHKYCVGSVAPGKSQHAGKATTLLASGIRPLVNKYGLNRKSTEKRLPAEFYGLSDRQIAIFMNRILACDGSMGTSAHTLEIGLSSEGLIDDLRFLLLRLGVVSRKHKRMSGYKDASGEKHWFPFWRLFVASVNIRRFLDLIGPVLGKEREYEIWMKKTEKSRSNKTRTDVVPVDYAQSRVIASYLKQHGGTGLPRGAHLNGRLYSRAEFENLVKVTGYDGPLAWLARSDLTWVKVSSVEDVGVQPVVDLRVPATHNFVGGGVVLHNTFIGSIAICRLLYEISCLKNPHRTFGLAKGSNVSIVCLSVTEDLAVKVAFENIAAKLEPSPYFEEHFPLKKTKKEIQFPNGIMVAARSSTDTSVLGLNVIGYMLDEGNFMPKTSQQKAAGVRWGHVDRAETLYVSLKRRMKSRFERHGRMPGLAVLVSSKNITTDFTARRVKESKSDPKIFVRDRALWDVKPPGTYSAKVFYVFAGNEQTPSKLLEAGEQVQYDGQSLPEGCVLVSVPEDFRFDFERDLEGALRDIAGVSTTAVHPFIMRREKIADAIDPARKHPFSVMSYDPSKPGQFIWTEMVKLQYDALVGGEITKLRPVLNPTALRHVHIDQSLRRDCTGFCMAHVGGYKDVVRRTDEGRTYMERAPLYVVDFVLQIVPPVGGEIIIGDIRKLIYDLSAHGYPIVMITADSYQSADGMQQLSTRGYKTAMLSVDTSMEPYTLLKEALYEGRLSYYAYPVLQKELGKLEVDEIKKKIDHDAKGSKDVADAVAGCIASLSQTVGLPVPVLSGVNSSQDDTWLAEQTAARGGGDSEAGNNETVDGFGLLPPFLVGSGSDWSGGWNGL